MRKLALLLCTTLLATVLCVGCGNSGSTNNTGDGKDTQQGSTNDVKADGFVFVYNGTDIVPNAKMEPIVTALGEPTKYFESDSCAFQGKDKVYTYGSVVICTYPENEVDYVYTIELKDDTVQTKEGIYIGSSVDDVKAKYGEPAKDTGSALVYEKGTSTLNFGYADGVVTSIVYYAVVE
ncbi:MAG: hypothetical protein IJ419_06390 [Agathobacter sp.]|nr:hypothetical protein [Agathobacter sp.]